MSRSLSNCLGAIAAWLCLAPVALAREALLIPRTFAPAFTLAHLIVNLPLFLIWIAGGVFLLVGGLLAFAPCRFRARKSDPLSGLAQAHRSTEVDLAWTVIPVLVLVLLLA
jgi:cytochrome c oxidase subunit II